jgi:hypothetical protein
VPQLALSTELRQSTEKAASLNDGDPRDQPSESGGGDVQTYSHLDRLGSGTVECSAKAAILVLGMHRSGTSSLAGALALLGGTAPLNLIPPLLENPRGFWESSVLVTLNDEILAAAGSYWEDWREFDPARIDAAARTALQIRAKSALRNEFGDASLPIVKDPRMCRLMPFWSTVFQESNWSVRPVLQLRSPLEVALSLNRRNGIQLSRGCLIWLRHVLDAEVQTRGMRRAVLNWNDFLDDRRGALERAREQLDLTWPRWSHNALAEIDEFVSVDLRHQRASQDDLRLHPAINDLVRETNAAMIELVKEPTDSKARRRLDDARARFEDAAAIFEHAMFETEEESRGLQSQARRERDEHATQLAAERDQFARQLAAGRDQFARQLAAEQCEFSGQLADVRNDAARQLAAMRDDFAGQLSRAKSGSRFLAERVDKADRRLARADDIVAYMAGRYAQERRSRARTRFRDYLRAGSKARKELDVIRRSIFFDEGYYLDKNPDVRAGRMDAALHYLLHGWREGRDPGPFFSTRQYLVQYPDVAASGLNAIVHYETQGRREMRNILLSRG